jgi:hypothetical protein
VSGAPANARSLLSLLVPAKSRLGCVGRLSVPLNVLSSKRESCALKEGQRKRLDLTSPSANTSAGGGPHALTRWRSSRAGDIKIIKKMGLLTRRRAQPPPPSQQQEEEFHQDSAGEGGVEVAEQDSDELKGSPRRLLVRRGTSGLAAWPDPLGDAAEGAAGAPAVHEPAAAPRGSAVLCCGDEVTQRRSLNYSVGFFLVAWLWHMRVLPTLHSMMGRQTMAMVSMFPGIPEAFKTQPLPLPLRLSSAPLSG